MSYFSENMSKRPKRLVEKELEDYVNFHLDFGDDENIEGESGGTIDNPPKKVKKVKTTDKIQVISPCKFVEYPANPKTNQSKVTKSASSAKNKLSKVLQTVKNFSP